MRICDLALLVTTFFSSLAAGHEPRMIRVQVQTADAASRAQITAWGGGGTLKIVSPVAARQRSPDDTLRVFKSAQFEFDTNAGDVIFASSLAGVATDRSSWLKLVVSRPNGDEVIRAEGPKIRVSGRNGRISTSGIR